MKIILSQTNRSFGNWELFTRSNELRNYEIEREKRKKIYLELKNFHNNHRSLESKIFKKSLKETLFGNKINVKELLNDPRIPPLHEFNLYSKALHSEEELDKFFNFCDVKLKILIEKTKNDIDILKKKLDNPKKILDYEYRNQSIYLKDFEKIQNEVLSQQNEEKQKLEEMNNYKKTLVSERQNLQKNLEKTMKIYLAVDKFIKSKKYDVYNLTDEQSKEIQNYYSMTCYKEQVTDYFDRHKENEYAEALKKGFMNRKIRSELEDLKKDFKKKLYEKSIYRPAIKGINRHFQGMEYLTQEELDNFDIELWQKQIDKSRVERMFEEEKEKEQLNNLRKKREELEVMLSRFFDRAVKKKNKPRVRELDKAKNELQKLEEVNESQQDQKYQDNLEFLH